MSTPHQDPESLDADRAPAANPNDGEPGTVAPITPAGADRLAEPVDLEQAPRLPFPVVGIGGSAGSLEALIEFFRGVRADCGLAFVVIQHLPPERHSLLADILGNHTTMPVREVEDGLEVVPNAVYVIRPGNTLTIRNGVLHLGEPLEKRGHRHPVDDFFRSLAEEQRERAIAIVMSGMGSNGTQGAHVIKAVGGVCIAQEPESARYASMPQSLLDAGLADFVLKPAEMGETLERYARHPYATGRAIAAGASGSERQALNEILSLLRNRLRHDFTGYKRPTLIRRIERRMGLHQIESIAEYARYVRQNPSETVALSDDLMIHVTGFFRDPEVWDAFDRRVIQPLVRSREGGAIRAWVTACSTGEEAYTIAMLLAEACTRAERHFDIKIFATDTAERSLSQARSGLYAAGIEAELTPERLDRFFEREDAMYRIKSELREMVVFAPQNLLQDPPFSRLDICTCRNLLIYLEPGVQQRALELMHFGLREGGVLLLGTSETVTSSDTLFEPIDKKHRIYRRVGPTRHGAVDFPLLQTVAGVGNDSGSRPRLRATVAMLTNKALLERYTPPSVVINRDHHILYFHGRTERYLDQPRGEPTRDLLTLAHESVRGPLRTAIQQAIGANEMATAASGLTRVPDGRRRRIVVTAAPLEARDNEPYYLVSFVEEFENDAIPPSDGGDGVDDYRELAAELQRVRNELESTVQELYSSNEEMKAAHEEATSINEEMQSTNEELETSKEELQSLNEELITVNTQLQAKMEELEATTNDLSSLLSSTSIAVVFLDTTFRIRRFTPAVQDLIDLIPSDVGRPLNDLARKFDDDGLLGDATHVLAELVPREREVTSHSGRIYMRRILPYRTSDNRIDGVVLTFVDVTARAYAERALRDSDEQHRLILEGLREYGIFMLDAAGRVVNWTDGAERLMQYTATEAQGKPLSAFLAGTDAVRRATHELEAATANGSAIAEGWHVRKTGSEFWASAMIAAVRNPRGELLGFVKVVRDHTEQKLAEEALQQAKRAAETANDAKDNFLANVSHEMRTPLSAILLWTNLIREQDDLPHDQLLHALGAINRSAEEQRELIEDLVDTSRIAAGKFVLDRRPNDFAAIVRACIDGARPAALQKNVTVTEHIDAAVGTVAVDAPRLQQVVNNLLGNAIKFAGSGRSVHVRLARIGDDVELVVQDSGIGIAPEFLPHVFDRFSQARNSRTRSNNGLGLGLAIVRYVVELHGGTVQAESAGVGRGATFTVRMPLPLVADAGASPDGASPDDDVRETLSGRLTDVHILLVEDVAETREALCAVLQQAGAQVVATESAAMATEAFNNARPDIIVSDLGLPDVDGFDLIGRIRKAERALAWPATPAIALTAFASHNIRREALDAGFQLCLTKPIQPIALVREIAVLCHRRPAP